MDIAIGEIDLNSLQEFEHWFSEIFNCHKGLALKNKNLKYHQPLFRGHANSDWQLLTTLERSVPAQFGIEDYYKKVRNILSKLNAYTEKEWDIDWSILDEFHRYTTLDLMPTGKSYKLYELLVYLRHNGFPSPLLDWTVSPYIAAFFAFDNIQSSETKKVSIYAYLETLDGTKFGELDRGNIWSIGPNLNTHRRHFLQQCRYTVCISYRERKYLYVNHEAAIDPENKTQDVLIKANLPLSLKAVFLKRLAMMNISAYALFGGDDNLIKSLANESFVFGD